MAPSALDDLRAALLDTAGELRGERPAPSQAPSLERPPRAELGDYSTNAAMLLAPVLKSAPRSIAEQLGEGLSARLGSRLDHVEVAGPGFLNVFLADAWYADAATRLFAAGDAIGAGSPRERLRVNVEFVSANPTGPLHVGHARNAAYGDSLSRILAFLGHEVHREYYVNDYGSQVRKFGESLRSRARGDAPPEDGYHGEYVTEIAGEIPDAATGEVENVARRGIELMLERLATTLGSFNVHFDTWFSERDLHRGEPSLVQHAFDVLAEQGRTYRSEGALWLRTTEFGDDKDRVLERSSGDHTYFASDIAYHQEKRERGFDSLVDVWGADHHGYVQRMQAAFGALGGGPDQLDLVIMQFVNLVDRGERSSMSKRRGDFVTLDELLEQIGSDAARWYLLNRSHDTTIDLDLELARKETNENPVYYVQYAHARIASILARAGEARVAEALAGQAAGRAGPDLQPAERELVKKALTFGAEVAEAAARRAPHRIATYALEYAQAFTAFYRDCPVLGAEPEEVEAFRLGLCVASKHIIGRSLDLLGVSAPESM